MNDLATVDVIEQVPWPEAASATAERAARAALTRAGPPGPVELSITLSDDGRQRELNRIHRGLDRPTNVLSFPAATPEEILRARPSDQPPLLLGDVVLARETLEQEAGAAHLPFGHHLVHLVVHGVLHLLGYDHERDDEAEVMERLEAEILSSLDVGDPYAVPSETAATESRR